MNGGIGGGLADSPAGNTFDAAFDPPSVQNTERRDAVEGRFHAASAGGLHGWQGGIEPGIDTGGEQLGQG